jgi:hypothetical protein
MSMMMIAVMTTTSGSSDMSPMTIAIMTIAEQDGLVHASVAVDVPEIGAQAHIDIRFPVPTGTGPEDWREEAYDRALMMLDPA